MTRRNAHHVEDDVARRIEGDRAAPEQREPPVLGDFAKNRLGPLGRDCGRRLAREAEDHGAVGRVTLAGPGERAEQCDVQSFDPVEITGRLDLAHEGERRQHGPDGVGRRRPDPDLEQLEDTDHAAPRSS